MASTDEQGHCLVWSGEERALEMRPSWPKVGGVTIVGDVGWSVPPVVRISSAGGASETCSKGACPHAVACPKAGIRGATGAAGPRFDAAAGDSLTTPAFSNTI